MPKGIKDTIEAKGFAIQIYTEDFKNEYISLTDIARYKSDEPFIVINNWLRSKDNIRFLGYGNQCITLILNLSNSIGLKMKQVVTHLHCHHKNGLKRQKQ